MGAVSRQSFKEQNFRRIAGNKTTGRGKVFLHHDGALGDILLSLPCIRLIRESAPLVHIAGRRDVAGLLHKTGVVDEQSSVGSFFYSSLYTDHPDERVRDFLSGFDASYVFTVNPDSAIARAIKSILPDTRVILTVPPAGSPEHAAEFRLRQCGYVTDEAYKRIALSIPHEERRWGEEVLKQYDPERRRHIHIAIHCGSGGRQKNWPAANYEALINMIVEDHRMTCIVFSGPAEDSDTMLRLSRAAERHAGVIHIHNESLPRVAALLSLSDYYIGNDSGISHLAGTVQCRGIALFGPTDARTWRPLGANMDVIRFDGKDNAVIVSASQVYSRITGDLYKGKTK